MPRVRLPAAVRDQWPRIGLALIGGALCPLAYAPFGWWPVAFLAPAVLVYLVADPDRGWALPAYAWGVGWFAAGGFWIYHSVMFYGGGLWAAIVFCLVLALLFGLIPLLAVGLWRLVRPRHEALALMAALPLAWVLVEWVRGWLFTGITWLQLGYTQTDTWLNGFAPVIGSLGISLLVATGAGALAWAARQPGQQRIVPVAAGVALVFVAGLALRQADWTTTAGEPLSAALLQGNIGQDVKWDPEYRAFIMDRYRRLTSEHWGADLVVWPETAVPMYQDRASAEYLAPLGDEAAFHGTDLLLGLPTFDESSRRAYNSVMALGDQVGFYHKRHLVPFGEYVPFRAYLGGLLDVFGAPMGDFSAGTSAGTLRAGGRVAAISICYEVIFPRLMATALPEATYLVNVSNDGWFGRTIGPHQHLQMARMRAMEFRRPLLRSTNTGITAAVDERGRIIERAPQFRPASLAATIQPRQGATPYLRWLNAPVVAVCAIGLIAFGALRWYPRARGR
ncbi:apolipoprotein N-acyltransferase [Aquisalimonas lutea]|uniref:apolipoprotein N-acyltransferase n=1 Tax=Aquisalimonas lutea TaxID=1327750 RepID=UPI0025B2E6F6|nr:apolipoprotein N-acyltransferase [Aquisalimonas lutea]MDN3517357.1 apolipoprotein N-acyltransferase [Aquisalimonas lutea]